jgi:chromosome partitioning protein
MNQLSRKPRARAAEESVEHVERARPKTIVVASPKGGCGKSTVARALAVRAAQLGRNVVAFDFDTQRTLCKWWAKRPDEGRANMRVEGLDFDDWSTRFFDLQKEMDSAGRLTAEILIMDLPPSVEYAMGPVRAMIEKADYVLVPTQPSEDDVETVEPWMESVRKLNPRAAFVLNRVNRQARSTSDYQNRLLETGRLCPILILESEEVKKAHTHGCTVLDINLRSEVPKRFEGLYSFVAQEIGA